MVFTHSTSGRVSERGENQFNQYIGTDRNRYLKPSTRSISNRRPGTQRSKPFNQFGCTLSNALLTSMFDNKPFNNCRPPHHRRRPTFSSSVATASKEEQTRPEHRPTDHANNEQPGSRQVGEGESPKRCGALVQPAHDTTNAKFDFSIFYRRVPSSRFHISEKSVDLLEGSKTLGSCRAHSNSSTTLITAPNCTPGALPPHYRLTTCT